MPGATANQTIGPFWHVLEEQDWADLTRFGARGEVCELRGRITDGEGALVTDACVEVWQSGPAPSDDFPGWGRCASDAQGQFHIRTLFPAPEARNREQAPHFAIMIHARGLLKPLVTRAYLEGHPANERDPVLLGIDPARRPTLLARVLRAVGDEISIWHFEIRLQGEGETVFFEI